ncbi:UDP-N-acetylenolpyruvoylglucosamine reductase [Frankliniella fusca]|uniref:UDP-N-acetylenolpyruvoylglucosamine reductase n=1 Tax=Frankliniella fusca TaxID=407009 RepID=A0AAE1GWK7_9NEOP|nr:UDP-N-acetylenolpyruvoylglucosamine reductase [Frankliniella fusca]
MAAPHHVFDNREMTDMILVLGQMDENAIVLRPGFTRSAILTDTIQHTKNFWSSETGSETPAPSLRADKVDEAQNHPQFEGDCFVNRVAWTDECIIGTAGSFNSHNEHHYAADNPHCTKEVHVQGRETVRVWAGLLHDRIIGPFFFEENVNAENYTDFLMHELDDLLDGTPLAVRRAVWFQQDGHPAHTSLAARAALGVKFPQRWIWLHSPTQEWAPRSPDLAEPDFYLWGMLKGRMTPPLPANAAELES